MWPEMKDPKLLLEVAMPLLASLNIARQELYCGIRDLILSISDRICTSNFFAIFCQSKKIVKV